MIQLQRQTAAGPTARQGGMGDGGMTGTSSSSSSSSSSMARSRSGRPLHMSILKESEGDSQNDEWSNFMKSKQNNNLMTTTTTTNTNTENMATAKRRKIGGGRSTGGGSRAPSPSVEDGFVDNAATENTVVVISMNAGCCMSHVAQRLLRSLGVNPTIVEADAQHSQAALEAALRRKLPCESENPTVPCTLMPAVFIGGRLLGGVDTLLSSHISGHLIPRLKEAGALWL